MIKHLLVSTIFAAGAADVSQGLSVSGPLAWIIIAGAVFSAGLVIYKVLWPLTRAVVHISEQWSSLDKLADQADSLVRIAAIADVLVKVVDDVHELKEGQEEIRIALGIRKRTKSMMTHESG